MKPRVVGLGQRLAGDDAVGLEVLGRLRRSPPAGVELSELRGAPQLLELLETPGPVIVVDALDDPEHAGRVQVLGVDALDGLGGGLSSHGLSAAEAVRLAGELYGADAVREVRFVAISVAPRAGFAEGLSASARAAGAVAERCVRRLLAEGGRPTPRPVETASRA